ncbi:MAG: hypothetical protein RMK84_12175 [Oscillochloridaceae bacterium]|nr:hypothetical protein [Chloroflexaceae bacterium]MDW8390875.1 hypothetical protein [Oscillochloridaceae bacterium]
MPAQPALFAFQSDPDSLSRPDVKVQAANLGARWVRLDGFLWHNVQAQPGGWYDWQALERVDRALTVAGEPGLTPVGIIRGALVWAGVVPSNCAAIRDEYLGEFAAFLDVILDFRFWVLDFGFWILGFGLPYMAFKASGKKGAEVTALRASLSTTQRAVAQAGCAALTSRRKVNPSGPASTMIVSPSWNLP